MKPSERINEIHDKIRESESYPLSYFRALEQYLDEQAAKKICSVCAENHLATNHLEDNQETL